MRGPALADASTLTVGGDGSTIHNDGGWGGGGYTGVSGSDAPNADAGGDGGGSGGYGGGDGGGGGGGLLMIGADATITNDNTITGGNGGYGSYPGSAGVGGAGIYGNGATITNSGTINGGISFTGGMNSLTLESGSTINGAVYSSREGNDTLALGGDEDKSFDLSTIGTQYLGFGNFAKTGSSIWTLSGTTDPQLELDPMPWTIRDGTLVVGDADHTDTDLVGSVKINADGTLAGFGTITGNVSNYLGGAVLPGSLLTTGKLTINGNYTQIGDRSDYTGSLLVLVTPTRASQLAVTGTATLGGTVEAIYAPGVYEATSYTILTAGSVSGTFETLKGKTPEDFTLDPSLAYSDTTVDLVLGATKTVTPTDDTTFNAMGSTAISGAQGATGTLLDYLGGLGGDGGNDGTATLIRPIRIALAGDEGLKGLLSPCPRTQCLVPGDRTPRLARR